MLKSIFLVIEKERERGRERDKRKRPPNMSSHLHPTRPPSSFARMMPIYWIMMVFWPCPLHAWHPIIAVLC